ncbi:NAD-dependent epimerase/dehydratase family protein [Ruminococcaceae bacterium OttesenSCG-928-I18]|nr:NAD-dependent epimerase/dehydratase family protein [Ruminococcaceae bacterium OttesenSCG-928-I18]
MLITGAAGFIGSQLAYRLWKENAELVLVDDYSYGREDNLVFPDHDFTEAIIRLDICNKEGVTRLFQPGDIDYVYNLAGIAPLPDCQSAPQHAIEVNVIGLVNLLENGRRYGVKKLIQASTNAIYENETTFPTEEEGFALPSLIYPNTKYAAERFCASYHDTYGMNITCLRFANVYGPHIDCLRKQPPFVAYMIRELYYNRTPIFHSDGTQRRDYVYVSDLIDLALRVQSSQGFDQVNVSSGENYSVNEFYAIAQEIMGKDIPAQYADDAHYWEAYPTLYEGAYPIKNDVLAREINKCTLCDNSRAREKYGWSPKVSVREGLAAVIEHECALLAELEKRGG